MEDNDKRTVSCILNGLTNTIDRCFEVLGYPDRENVIVSRNLLAALKDDMEDLIYLFREGSQSQYEMVKSREDPTGEAKFHDIDNLFVQLEMRAADLHDAGCDRDHSASSVKKSYVEFNRDLRDIRHLVEARNESNRSAIKEIVRIYEQDIQNWKEKAGMVQPDEEIVRQDIARMITKNDD